MRLDKLLANLNVGSRKEVHELLKKGSVTVNEAIVTKKDWPVTPETDIITVHGVPLDTRIVRYIKFHKPAGYITATEDTSQPTVMDLLPEAFLKLGIKPVGRLDKDTEGLLLLTNDGQWAHKIIHGKKDIEKIYVFTYEGTLAADSESLVQEGIVLADGTCCKPGKLRLLGEQSAEVSISEGKYHQVKRMMAACGIHVTYLKRVAIGAINLSSIENTGEYADLTKEEWQSFF